MKGPARRLRLSRKQVLGFRLSGQTLDRRVTAAEFLQRGVPLPDDPWGAAQLSLHARVAGLTPARFGKLVGPERKLVRIFGAKGAAQLVPARELGVFTRGLFPEDEAAARLVLAPITPLLDKLSLTATKVFEAGGRALDAGLARGPLSFDELVPRLKRALPKEFAPHFSARQLLVLLKALGRTGRFLLVPEATGGPHLVRTEDWLDRAPPETKDGPFRLQLARRYLSLHGPATAEDFAAWAGLPFAAGRATFDKLGREELTQVKTSEGESVLLTAELMRLKAKAAEGLWLLPSNDPLLDSPGRGLIVPEARLHPAVWSRSRDGGVILVDGEVRGRFELRQFLTELQLEVGPFRPLTRRQAAALHDQALVLAAWRGASHLTMTSAR